MITLPFDIEQINEQLLAKFGRTLDGKQKFRVVWSDDQLEYRKVEFVSGIQLIFPEVRQVKKYNYAPERWVLERWFAHNNPEILGVIGGTYEPVWVFQNFKGDYLRPVYRAAEIICLAAEGGVGEGKSVKDYMSEDKEKLNDEIKLFEEMLAEEGRDFGNQTDAFVSPIFMDSTKQKMRE